MRRYWYATALAAAAVLALAGCTQPSNKIDSDPLKHAPGQVYFYGTDGNMLNGIGDLLAKDHPNALVGMKGTTPLSQLTQSFRDRLRSVDPGLIDETFAGESYDAVVISALAAEIAHSTKSSDIAAQITGVTTRGTACETAKACFDLVHAGKDIAYTGISLRLGGLTDTGEPSASTYGILRFATQNTNRSAKSLNAGAVTPGYDPIDPAADPVADPIIRRHSMGKVQPYAGMCNATAAAANQEYPTFTFPNSMVLAQVTHFAVLWFSLEPTCSATIRTLLIKPLPAA